MPCPQGRLLATYFHGRRQMAILHERFPHYGFAQHMGYPTAAHFAALKEFGVCEEHRRSFSPVRNVLEAMS